MNPFQYVIPANRLCHNNKNAAIVILNPSLCVILNPSLCVILNPSLCVILNEVKNLSSLRACPEFIEGINSVKNLMISSGYN